MIVDIIDSYYLAVQAQMAVVSSIQQFGGVIQARDWPSSPPLQNTLYLLFISAHPISGGSESQNLFEILAQWSWITIGTDLQANQVAANRGDRYRASMSIVNNLRQANYPSFCRKQTITGVNQGTGDLEVSLVQQSFPGNPSVDSLGVESVWWSKLTFMPKQDNPKSGFIYGAASVRIYGWDDVLAAVA